MPNGTITANTTSRVLDFVISNTTTNILNTSNVIYNGTSPILENGTHIASTPLAVIGQTFRIPISPPINITSPS